MTSSSNRRQGARWALGCCLVVPLAYGPAQAARAAQNNVLMLEHPNVAPTEGTGARAAARVRRQTQQDVTHANDAQGAPHVIQTPQRNFVDSIDRQAPMRDASHGPAQVAPPNADASAASAASDATTAASAASTSSAPLRSIATVPDERPLWALLHAHRLADYDHAISQLEHRQPSWRPSASLAAERLRQQRDADVAAALQNHDAAALRLAIALQPDAFDCAHIDRVWQAADVFAQSQHLDDVDALYRKTIPACEPADNRIATLYRAEQQLPAARVDALIEIEASEGRRDAAAQDAFERLRYQRAIVALGGLPPDSARAASEAARLAQSIRRYRDGASAALAGWIAYAHHDAADAQSWFASALAFSPENVDAKLGLAQVRIQAHDYDAAQSLLDQPTLRDDARARAARAQIALARANDAYAAHRYAQSLQWLDVADQEGAAAAEGAALRGWTLYAMGRYAQAAQAFRVRYEARHDDDSAEGIALSMHAMGDRSDRGDTDKHGEPERATSSVDERRISAYLAAIDAQSQYYRKQFVESKATLSDALSGPAESSRIARYVPADLSGVDAPSVTAGLAWFDHVGVAGQGRLQTFGAELEGKWLRGTTQFALRYRQSFIDAGAAPLDVGSLTSASSSLDAGTKAKLNDLAQRSKVGGSVRAEALQASMADSVRIGAMPTFDWRLSLGGVQGAPTGFEPNASGAIGQQTSWGRWTLYAGMSPVRDSMLSWRGIALPQEAGGDRWGAVRRTAGGGQLRWQVAPRWNVGAAIEGQWLTGRNVIGNEGLSMDLSAAYDLRLHGFDYFNVGPTLHYLAYRRNENFYGWGQGGYYSPQSSMSAGLAVQWLTIEGRRTQLRGSVEAGWNDTLQHSQTCLPLGVPAGLGNALSNAIGQAGANSAIDAMSAATCSGSHDHGPYASTELAAVTRLSSRLQAGALVTANVTPGRDRQFGAALFIRYFFEPRAAVFSNDLPSNSQR